MTKNNNTTIAKNTVFLYFRMAVTMLVGLYTSRVILNVLGVNDFGIYNVAGSAVAIWAFLYGAIGQSSSRFITFQLGRIDIDGIDKLKSCFGTTQLVMAFIALLILLICETIGLWVLFNKCGIPDSRMTAAFWTYQISVLTSMFAVTQIPFTALIISHEKMSIYAYTSIVEVVLKLIIVYILLLSPFDKLIFYSILLCIVQISMMIFYRIYCRIKFEESKAKMHLDKELFKPILSFSGWSLFGSASSTLFSQLSNIVISAFFSPSIVAAKAISTQVRNQASSFVSNFRTAANPQIIKRYSEEDFDGYKKLLFQSTNISFYLMMIVVLPFIIEAEIILKVWLKIVPDYSVAFVQVSLLEALFSVYDLSFFMIFQATGRLKENAIVCPLLDVIVFIIIIVFYSFGSSPLAIAWGLLFLSFAEGVILKPYLAIKYFNFKWSEFYTLFKRNAIITVISGFITLGFKILLGPDTILNVTSVILVSFLVSVVTVLLLGLTNNQRDYIIKFLSHKIHI